MQEKKYNVEGLGRFDIRLPTLKTSHANFILKTVGSYEVMIADNARNFFSVPHVSLLQHSRSTFLSVVTTFQRSSSCFDPKQNTDHIEDNCSSTVNIC